MKTKVSVFSPHFFGILLFLFGLNLLSLPSYYSIVDFNSMQLGTDRLAELMLTMFVVFLFSAACAAAVFMLTRKQDVFFGLCAALLVADPLLKCSIINIRYLLLFVTAVILCFYLIKGESIKLKTLFASLYILISTTVYSESVSCHIPVVVLVYGFSIMAQENSKAVPAYVNQKKSESRLNIKNSKVIYVSLPVIAFVLSLFIREKLLKRDLYLFDIGYQNIGNLTARSSFWVAVIPYVCLLLAFTVKYILVKSEGKKINFAFLMKNAKFLWVILLSVLLVAAGKAVFGYNTGITVINTIFVASAILIYLNDQTVSSQVVESFLQIYRKHKFIMLALAFVWFLAVQYLFKDTQRTVIDSVMEIVGNRL